MKNKVQVDEYGYIPRYQNMSYGADAKMYNDLQDKMSALYCKWYGSAYGLSSYVVSNLKEAIKKGKITYSAWAREFEDNAYKSISGHTLTEERKLKKEQKIKCQAILKSILNKIEIANILTDEEFSILEKQLKIKKS